jgi:hypothetical protein
MPRDQLMSALGQKQTCAAHKPIADIAVFIQSHR